MSNVFELVKETAEQVIVKVNAKDLMVIAEHPYVDAQMAYITVTRGDEHIWTVVREDGSTWSWHTGKGGHTCVSENVNRLREELETFLAKEHVFLGVRTELNPYAAKFYTTKNRHGNPTNTWLVDFMFCDTKQEGRRYFSMKQYPTPEKLVEQAFAEYNELFRTHGPITEEPNWNVGTVYHVEIGNDW